MLASMKCGRNSIGIEIDPEYCRMAAVRLRDENQSLFSTARLEFLKLVNLWEKQSILKEQPASYGSRKRGTVSRRSSK